MREKTLHQIVDNTNLTGHNMDKKNVEISDTASMI